LGVSLVMAQDLEEKIALLRQFEELLGRKFDGKYQPEGPDELRRKINEMAPRARRLLIEARCLKTMSASPPPAIGGPVLQNVDPFDMIFENYYGMSFIPNMRDMTQQAIGVYLAGGLPEKEKSEPDNREHVVYKQLEVPEKVTLGWLAQNVPIKFWLMAGGIVLAAFTLGIKASAWRFVQEILGLVP
jgi:hypothetical protein